MGPPESEKKFEYIFTLFDRTHERDRRTNRQPASQPTHDGMVARMHSMALQKSVRIVDRLLMMKFWS